MKKHFLLFVFCGLISSSVFANTNIPPGFIENKGQIADDKHQIRNDIQFKVEQPGLNAYFKPDGIIYHAYRSEDKLTKEYSKQDWENFNKGDLAAIGKKVYFFRMDFELIGSNKNATVVKQGKHSILRNYYLANCPNGITGVEEYDEITYKDVYPSIDLRYYYKEGHLKYEFIVHPGGDASQIKFRYNGATNTLVENEELVVKNIYHDLTEAKPYTFMEGSRSEVSNSFVVNDNGEVSFNTGEYDHTSALVIDPIITWATYYNNGSSSDPHCNSAFDSNGKIYSAFGTYSATWPTINAGGGQYYDAVRDGTTDLIVLGFNADYSVQWATYYGGSDADYLCGHGGDYGKTIAVDQNNNVYVAGFTGNTGGIFPTQSSGAPGSFYQDQTRLFGGDNPFLLKFNSNGVRQWATIYNHEQPNTNSAGLRINGICVSGTKVYFTGQTYRFNSNDIPLRTLAGAYNQTTFLGAQDPFIGRFDDNCILEWSTYFNSGSVGQTAYKDGADLHVDASGNLLLVGHASSGGSNTSAYLLNPGGGAYFQSAITGSIDVYIAKFNTSMQPVWATYYGGTELDRVSQVSSDASGNVLVACRTIASNNFPVFDPGGGAYYQGTKPSTGTNWDGAIMKFSSSGVRQWATYVGATTGNNNSVTGVGADGSGNVYAIGYTAGSNFTVLNDGSFFQGTTGGGNDLFYMKFNASSVLQSSTYYGSTGSETCYGVKLATATTGCDFKQFNFFITNSPSLTTVNPGGAALYQTSPTTANANACILFTTVSGTLSTAPTGINLSPVVNCSPGYSVNLQAVGGVAGGGSNFYWYTGSCGGTAIGTGSTINVSPVTSTTYYVRREGTCNTTTCFSITVDPPAAVSASTTLNSNVSCFGGNNGAATVNPSGGVGSYTYSWSPSGGTGISASGLSANTYTVTVTDGNSCSNTATVTISQPSVVTANISATDEPNCFGGSDGQATVTPGGGVGSYTYLWSPSGGTGATATGLSANTYTVTVTDGNSCSVTTSTTISQPSIVTANISSSDEPSCFGGSNGEATVTPGGGVGSYTYSWSPSGGTGATGTGLSANTYTVTVTDGNSCSATASTTISQPTVITATIVDQDNPLCFGDANGSATVNASGGTGAFTFAWSPTGGTAAVGTGLSDGVYTVTVTDANLCTQTATATLVEPIQLTCGTSIVSNPNPPASDGSMAATASGGSGGYTFGWSPAGGTAQLATGLSAGTDYTVTVTDANGCTCTSTLNFGNVSIDENETVTFNLYPNPGTDYFQIQISGNVNLTNAFYKVYDIAGKVVINKSITGELMYVDMQSFSSGIYMVNIQVNDQTITRRWIKK